MSRDLVGGFELLVLLAVIRVADDAYGVTIAEAIEESTGRDVLLGSVYAALERLEQKGLVTSSLGEPTAARGGRAKRYFQATSSGVREARAARRALTSLWRRVPKLAGGQT
jgi:DNA-binding PadR family transcriptional regulator